MKAGAVALVAAALAAAGCAAHRPAPVFVEAPPAVQRAPGWCAPASLSRALACAGVSVDQAELARRGGCTPDGGVDVATFCRALRTTLALRGLALSPLVETDPAAAFAVARRYDSEAHRLGLPPLSREGASAGGTLSLDAFFADARAEPMRLARAGELPRFRRAVRRALSRGRPALWGVVLGIVPEPGPAGAVVRGGHVRLLVGFDPDRGVVSYSDPWEPDCAAKEMPEADACAVTMSLWALEDRPGAVVVPR